MSCHFLNSAENFAFHEVHFRFEHLNSVFSCLILSEVLLDYKLLDGSDKSEPVLVSVLAGVIAREIVLNGRLDEETVIRLKIGELGENCSALLVKISSMVVLEDQLERHHLVISLGDDCNQKVEHHDQNDKLI